jgi:purine-binding chemotaxis protein CheW
MPADIVVFDLSHQHYALNLSTVRRIVRMAAYAPFPQAPEIVLGVIDVAGELVPVLDIRRRFRLPSKPPVPEDHLIVAEAGGRTVAFAVDAVLGCQACPPETIIAPDRVVPGLDYLRGVTRLPGDEIVLIHDLATFLSLDEATALDSATRSRPTP